MLGKILRSQKKIKNGRTFFELVSRGTGVGWLPYTMCRAGLASGDLVSLAEAYGSIPLDITVFAMDTHRIAADLLKEF